MARFERLTIEEARTLSREQLLPRIEDEQQYWYQRMNRMEIRVGDDDAFKTFTQIMHIVIDPGRSIPDTDYWKKPLGELGEL
jgi:hypothetical protein